MAMGGPTVPVGGSIIRARTLSRAAPLAVAGGSWFALVSRFHGAARLPPARVVPQQRWRGGRWRACKDARVDGFADSGGRTPRGRAFRHRRHLSDALGDNPRPTDPSGRRHGSALARGRRYRARVAASSGSLHEPYDRLQAKTRDMHRAIVSLMEELEAIDWYAQRAEAADDGELKAIVEHNGNEEREHAAMLLEWIRRRDPVFDRHLRTYLFRKGGIVGREREEEASGADRPADGPPARPSIGSLKEMPR